MQLRPANRHGKGLVGAPEDIFNGVAWVGDFYSSPQPGKPFWRVPYRSLP